MKHQPYLLMIHTILSVGGFISGIVAWFFLPDTLTTELRNYVTEELNTYVISCSWKNIFLLIFNSNIMDMLRVYFFGICLLGIPILIIFLFLKSFSIGFSACILLQSSFLLFSTRILFIPVLTIATLESCKFSLSLFQNNLQNPIRQLFYHTIRYALLVLLLFLVSSIDSLVNYLYLGQM